MVDHQSEEDVSYDPPENWLTLWYAARNMLQSYGDHRHEGRCERCNEAWDKLHAALLEVSRPSVTS